MEAATVQAEPITRSPGQSVDIETLSRNSRVIWSAIAAMLIVAVIGYPLSGLTFVWWAFATIAKCVAVLLTISLLYQRVRVDPWIGFGAESCAQLMLILTLGTVLSYIGATAGFPYSDAVLSAADNFMRLDWRAYLNFINDRPFFGTLTSFAYNSMEIEVIVLIFVLVATSRVVRLQQYVLANALGLSLTLLIFTFFPAGGIFPFLQIQPAEFANLDPAMTYDQLSLFESLRSDHPPLINVMAGIITFPSYHAVWAVFFIWAFFPIRQLRLAAIVLNSLVIVATPIQGAHYFVDVVGGIIVASISICCAIKILAFEVPTRENSRYASQL